MKKFIYIVIGLLVIAGIVFLIVSPGKPGKYDQFATCIKDKGVTFFGAFWCPHCQAEKARFGKSAHLLPYVECSMPDGQTQTPICKANDITTYPTWVFPASLNTSTTTPGIATTTGELELADLAQKTGCMLPE